MYPNQNKEHALLHNAHICKNFEGQNSRKFVYALFNEINCYFCKIIEKKHKIDTIGKLLRLYWNTMT